MTPDRSAANSVGRNAHRLKGKLVRRYRWKLSKMFLLTAVVAAVLGVYVETEPAFRASNCGGNSAALTAVKQFLLLVELANERPNDSALSVATATPWQLRELGYISKAHPYAHFLVSVNSFGEQLAGPRRVIMVCDHAFTNVPRYVVGHAPPTHAAAFSDGSSALISVAEFEALDRSSLAPLEELIPIP